LSYPSPTWGFRSRFTAPLPRSCSLSSLRWRLHCPPGKQSSWTRPGGSHSSRLC
jgi:hypothetical protein